MTAIRTNAQCSALLAFVMTSIMLVVNTLSAPMASASSSKTRVITYKVPKCVSKTAPTWPAHVTVQNPRSTPGTVQFFGTTDNLQGIYTVFAGHQKQSFYDEFPADMHNVVVSVNFKWGNEQHDPYAVTIKKPLLCVSKPKPTTSVSSEPVVSTVSASPAEQMATTPADTATAAPSTTDEMPEAALHADDSNNSAGWWILLVLIWIGAFLAGRFIVPVLLAVAVVLLGLFLAGLLAFAGNPSDMFWLFYVLTCMPGAWMLVYVGDHYRVQST